MLRREKSVCYSRDVIFIIYSPLSNDDNWHVQCLYEHGTEYLIITNKTYVSNIRFICTVDSPNESPSHTRTTRIQTLKMSRERFSCTSKRDEEHVGGGTFRLEHVRIPWARPRTESNGYDASCLQRAWIETTASSSCRPGKERRRLT